MQWLDREFWSLYKTAALIRAVPPSSGESSHQSRAALGQSLGAQAVSIVASSVSPANEWDSDEQRRLEAALVKHPSSIEPKQRWIYISADVGSKTVGQCISRFKFIRDTLKGGGSAAAAEPKAAPVTSAVDKKSSAMKIPVHSSIASAASASASAFAAASAVAAAASESSMPPIEIPDDLLTMTGVIAGSGMCSGSVALYHRIRISVNYFDCVLLQFEWKILCMTGGM
jgi:hypothetical protein